MEQVCLKAYAKVNLTLDIVRRRSDGYHLLKSVMQSISLFDTITLEKQTEGFALKSDHPLLPLDQTNICWRAFLAFQDHTKVKGGVLVTIDKKIPIAAGLGGGSADAAAVLYGLNQLFATNLSLQQLQEIGLLVGADVPFCLQGGTSLVQGIGESVKQLKPLPDAVLVLIKPSAAVSTAEVYQRLSPAAYGGVATENFLELLEQNQTAEVLGSCLANALETVTFDLVPDIAVWKKRLGDHGAFGRLMSGSGPTVFGLFTDEQKALAFQNLWQAQGDIYVVKPVQQGLQAMNGGAL